MFEGVPEAQIFLILLGTAKRIIFFYCLQTAEFLECFFFRGVLFNSYFRVGRPALPSI